MLVNETPQSIRAELKKYQKQVLEAVEHFPIESLYALEHLLRSTGKKKPSNSYWHSPEVVETIQGLVDQVVDVSIKKSRAFTRKEELL